MSQMAYLVEKKPLLKKKIIEKNLLLKEEDKFLDNNMDNSTYVHTQSIKKIKYIT